MGSIWTVSPKARSVDGEWERYDEKDGVKVVERFWLEVKERLTEGEKRRLSTAGFRSISTPRQQQATQEAAPPEIQIDWTAQSWVRTLTYVVDWSLVDDKKNKLPLSRETLEAMHPDAYAAIEAAINAHVEQVAQEGNVRSGAAVSKPISA